MTEIKVIEVEERRKLTELSDEDRQDVLARLSSQTPSLISQFLLFGEMISDHLHREDLWRGEEIPALILRKLVQARHCELVLGEGKDVEAVRFPGSVVVRRDNLRLIAPAEKEVRVAGVIIWAEKKLTPAEVMRHVNMSIHTGLAAAYVTDWAIAGDKVSAEPISRRTDLLRAVHSRARDYSELIRVGLPIVQARGKLAPRVEKVETQPGADTSFLSELDPDLLKYAENFKDFRVVTGAAILGFRFAALADLDMRGLLPGYYFPPLRGELIKKYNRALARQSFFRQHHIRLLRERNYRSALLSIARSRIPRLRGCTDACLDKLTDTERKMVETEYNHAVERTRAAIANRCGHLQLVRRLRAGDALSTLDKLRKFFKDYTPDELIHCNKCNYVIICPHMIRMIELDAKRVPYDKLILAMSKWARDGYCKVCGGAIKLEVSEGFAPTSGDDELRKLMWGEIKLLMRTIRAENVIDIPQLVNTIRAEILPYIVEIEQQLTKSRTSTESEIKARKRMYVTIYASAYIVRLVTSKDSGVYLRGVKEGASRAEALQAMLKAIVNMKNVIMREVPEMDADFIKSRLVLAYTQLLSASMEVTVTDADQTIAEALLLDPVPAAIITAWLSYRGEKRREYWKYAKEMLDIIKTKAAPTKSIWAGIRARYSVDSFSAWVRNPPSGGAPLTVPTLLSASYADIVCGDGGSRGKDTRRRNYLRYLRGLAFNNMFLRVERRGPIYEDRTPPGAILRADYVPITEFTDEFAQFLEKLDEAKRFEESWLAMRSAAYMRPFARVANDGTRQWRDPGVSIARVYDENGVKHRWSIFISAEGVEVKGSDYDIAKHGKPIDKICGECKRKFSEVEKEDQAAVYEGIEVKTNIANFFRYYANKCPKGALHDFDALGKCAKCGITSALILTGAEQPSGAAFYRLWRKKYAEDRAEDAAGVVRGAPSPAAPAREAITAERASEIEDYVSAYTFNFDVVLDLCDKVPANKNAFMALGSVDYIDYAEVLSGKYIPEEVQSYDSTRIARLDAMIREWIIEWGIFRRYTPDTAMRGKQVHGELLELITRARGALAGKHDLLSNLPSVHDDYNSVRKLMLEKKKPRVIVEFSLQTLAEIGRRIWEIQSPETQSLREEFVKYYVKKILHDDEMMTRAGYFNWSLLYGDKQTDSEYDPNAAMNLEEESDAYIEESLAGVEGFGDTESPMRNTFDMEPREDDEIEDRDSEEIQHVHVGEDYGLS